MPTTRNQVVRHAAILRKGGAHTHSVSGQRHQSKRQLDDEIDEYFNQSEGIPSDAPDENNKRNTQKGRRNSAPSSFWLVLSQSTNNVDMVGHKR